ncbi:MAG: hypothetical protein ACLR1V_06725 [Coprococcus sp.]
MEAYLPVIEDDKKWFQMLGESEDYDGSRNSAQDRLETSAENGGVR